MNKTENIIVRVTPEEKMKLAKLAEKHGLNCSEYIRAVIFENSELLKAVAKEAARQVAIFQRVINREK